MRISICRFLVCPCVVESSPQAHFVDHVYQHFSHTRLGCIRTAMCTNRGPLTRSTCNFVYKAQIAWPEHRGVTHDVCDAVQDMMAKGMIGQSDKVTFNIKVDPAIGGGVVYNLGDTIVDCSFSTLQNEFFSSLSAAGIQRVE